MQTSLRVVMVTNMYPTLAAPDDGTPVADEHSALEAAGCHVELLHTPREAKDVLFPGSQRRPEKRFELAQAAVARLGEEVEPHALAGLPHAEVPVWLNASDAVLLTCSHEGSPNVVKEALACNAPSSRSTSATCASGSRRSKAAHSRSRRLRIWPRSFPRCSSNAGGVAGRERVEEIALERVAARLLEIYASVARGSPGQER